MLFNSYAFIFAFLPITWLVFFQIGRISHTLAAGWLTAASLFFYAWWNPAYLGLLLASIVFNYSFGMWIAKAGLKSQLKRKKGLLMFALCADLSLLAYYKYTNFLLGNLNGLAGFSWTVGNIILPLGISFFTFTQIAFLVDTYQGKVKEYNFLHYGLFVTYFPHLIAGPILHHNEMMPQFAKTATYKWSYENVAVGLTIFFMGLFKKVILADGVAGYVGPVFDMPLGAHPVLLEAWGGALAYTFQLYFDFSGYSDMAIGLSRMFGVVLPLNFDSPYKATNIIEFWRRWHMTLSRFLRDYLYIPLGGNRKGTARRHTNLIITMLLGGLWHGAGWTFVIWGGLHGIYLGINHGWQVLRDVLGYDASTSTRGGRAVGRVVTMLAVVVAWVFFRAENLDAALAVLGGMAGVNGIVLPEIWAPVLGQWVANEFVHFGGLGDDAAEIYWIVGLFVIVWFTPSTQKIMQNQVIQGFFKKASANFSGSLWIKRDFIVGAVMTAVVFLILLTDSRQSTSPFIYFNF